ncbi:MAG: hypothetical protein WCG84_00990 [Candidatus Moraniibacteriota bacterium]
MWIALALGGYFLSAVTSIGDRFLLASKRIIHPAGYAFLTGLLSLFALLFAFFDVAPSLSWFARGIAILSGVFYLYGLLFLYTAVQKQMVSLTAPLVSVASSVGIFMPVFIVSLVAGGSQSLWVWCGVFVLLLAGGSLMAFERGARDEQVIIPWRPIILSGLFLALAQLSLKGGYTLLQVPFLSSIVWSRLGFFIGALSLLLRPSWRQEIFETVRDLFKKNEDIAHAKSSVTSLLFVVNKILGGAALLLIDGAIFTGSVALVQAMEGIRLAFVFLLAQVFSFMYPAVFPERFSWQEWLRKLLAFALFGVGIWLATQIILTTLPSLA